MREGTLEEIMNRVVLGKDLLFSFLICSIFISIICFVGLLGNFIDIFL
jgi:hypothetical protein